MQKKDTCPICLKHWTTYGTHRLCCLKCGHLFGLSCIHHQKSCPLCQISIRSNDIRYLYPKYHNNIQKSDLDNIKSNILKKKQTVDLINMNLEEAKITEVQREKQLEKYENEILELKSYLAINNNKKQVEREMELNLKQIIHINDTENCRLLIYEPTCNQIIVTVGNEIKIIDLPSLQIHTCTKIHNQQIRGLSVHKKNIRSVLSVGLDKKFAIIDTRSNKIAYNVITDYALWSCCWSTSIESR